MKTSALRLLLLTALILMSCRGVSAQVAITVSFGPPPIPVYEQPICPGEGYIWTPGYWDYDDDDGYYWVPGTWVEAPEPGYLWTPGYWGWGDGVYAFHEGYWGPHVGFYGGVNYGYGYTGHGYEGGRWDRDHFYYNTAVTHVNTTIIHNTYKTTIIENHNRVSYNGGNGGIQARPSAQDETYRNERHVNEVASQREHVRQARSNPELRAARNQGKPPIAATAKPADFRSGTVAARKAGGAYKAPPANTAHGREAPRTGNEAQPRNEARPGTNNHASEIPKHEAHATNAGNSGADRKYQQQQQKLAEKQNQEHQNLQQRQEKEHQQAIRKNADEAHKQQMEQRHTQQTQHMEQKHEAQQQRAQPKPQAQPHQSAPKPQENHRPN